MAQENDTSVVMPLVLSLLAGLSTCLGAAVVFCAQRKENEPPLSHQHLAFALSLAGSVMVTVSVASILPESFEDEENVQNYVPLGSREFTERIVSFALGCVLYVILSKLAFPEPDEVLGFDREDEELGQELAPLTRSPVSLDDVSTSTNRSTTSSSAIKRPVRSVNSTPLRSSRSNSMMSHTESSEDADPLGQSEENDKKSVGGGVFSGSDLTTPEARRNWRVAMLLFVSLAVHNFPEGLAVAASTLHSESLGITTSVAIALHNIPEGIAIAVPCLAARPDSPCLAFLLASLSGLAEPLGAAVALLVLPSHADPKQETSFFTNMKNVLAFVAGIMIMVAVRELFPEANRHSGNDKQAFILGTVTGMLVMIASDSVLDDA